MLLNSQIKSGKTTADDDEWFSLVQKGHRNSFRKVYDRYYKPVIFFAAKILNDDTFAEDIVSETFWKAWEHRLRFETPRHMENFLYLVTRNGCISFLRSDRVARNNVKELTRLSVDDELPLSPVELDREQSELLGLMYQKMDKISGCEVLRMSYLEGKSTQEIAAKLNTSENNVYILKSRSLRKLRSALSKESSSVYCLY